MRPKYALLNTLYSFYINKIHTHTNTYIYNICNIMMYNITNYIIVQFDLETFNWSHYNNTVYNILYIFIYIKQTL